MSLAVGSPNMGAWETDDEKNTPTFPTLKSPMEARTSGRNSRTPSRGSRRSRRSVTPPGRIAKSPPPMPGSDKTDKSERIPRDLATDEKISILDPRRFTPTLHANLVGEILSLKRDQEEKRRVIESLESQLLGVRDEEDGIRSSLQTAATENRSLKRQLALLEGGSSSALAELARERDEAVEAGAESKRRLEATMKKLKAQEDSADNSRGAWANDKNEWEEERRKTDRKIHVLESRLKTVLEEVAAYQMAMNSQSGDAALEQDVDDTGRDSDTGSVQTMSQRFSVLQRPTGHTLADELDFDDESDFGTETNGRDSVMSNYMLMRSDSRASVRAKFHRRHNSGDSLIRQGSVARGRLQHLQKESLLSTAIIQEAEEPISPAFPAVTYTDTGVQFSPPTSPVLKANKVSGPELRGVTALAAKWEKQNHEELSTEANSRRKRISIAKPLTIQAPAPAAKLMVSAAVQTADSPISPPWTPKSPGEVQQPDALEMKVLSEMVAAGTQTDAPTSSKPDRLENTLTRIPSIAVHPPGSRPSSPRKPLLPQLQRDIGCQVSLPAAPMVSSAVQTGEIRIDQRLDRLPAHLHPSAITSRPVSPAENARTTVSRGGTFTPVPGNIPARNPRRLASQSTIVAASPRASVELENSERTISPANSSRQTSAHMSNLFTAFHDVSSGDEMDDFGDADHSENEFRTALSAPRAVKSPEPNRSPASAPSSPETVVPDTSFSGNAPASPLGNTNVYNTYRLSGNQGVAMPGRNSSMKSGLRPSAMSSSSKGSMRKAALIQNGINAHQEDAADPPFPIPTRASSRQPMASAGIRPGADNRSPTRNEQGHRRGARTMHRANSLRKSRSAAAVPARNRHRKKSSVSPIPDAPSTPVPPMPSNVRELATPRNERPRGRGHRHQNSGTTATTEATTGFQSQTSSQTANGVVDAIAQTMVGEWMFKYVRRRKSFGLGGDGNGRDDSSNDRHKRWVWLAPYERAILWSSKQPSSGSALLGGKSGRKLTIQSVLDVKDDNHAPKGQLAVFNRSILILTPQRALKFTAVNADRHYLWLTALSFLAHSQQDIPDIPTPITTANGGGPTKHPQQQARYIQPSPDFPPPLPSSNSSQKNGTRVSSGSSARPRIRDSIRLAKAQQPSMVSPPRDIGGTTSMLLQQNQHQHQLEQRAISPIPDTPTLWPDTADDDADSAEPPVISRFSRVEAGGGEGYQFHGRKRSNTGGRVPPPLSFRGFGGAGVFPGYGHAVVESQSTVSDFHFGGGGGGGSGHRSAVEPTWSDVDRSDLRASMASSGVGGANMFEAIGTMRMEAFISPLAFNRFEAEGVAMNYPESMGARKRHKEARRRKSRSRSRSRTRGEVVRGGVAGWKEEYMSSYYGGGVGGGARAGRRDSRYGGMGRETGYRTAGEEEVGRGRARMDPFEGF